MEALIFIHETKRIFWRDHLPSNPTQYIRAYERATGVNEMVAQRGSGKSLIMPKKLHERGIAPASIVRTIRDPIYFLSQYDPRVRNCSPRMPRGSRAILIFLQPSLLFFKN